MSDVLLGKIPNGCVLLARKIKESEIWNEKPSWWFKVWVYILTEVNHQENEYFDRGTNYFSSEKIYSECALYKEGIKIHTISNLIKWLKRTKQITTRKTTRGLYITVCNYEYYQDMGNYKNYTENYMENEIGTKSKLHYKQQCNNVTMYRTTPQPLTEEQISLIELLKTRIINNNPEAKISNTYQRIWGRTLDKMMRIDKRSPERIREVIEWCQSDDFWHKNILSFAKLREKFDQLILRMKEPKKKYSGKEASDLAESKRLFTEHLLEEG